MSPDRTRRRVPPERHIFDNAEESDMADMFSDDWMNALKDEWNGEPDVKDKLAEINFSSTIGYGFKDEDKPAGFIKVENGECVAAGAYSGEELSWDIRASKDDWAKWMEKGIGMMGLGTAYATGKLKFPVGDYKSMIKDPRMAGPFVKSFDLMKRASSK